MLPSALPEFITPWLTLAQHSPLLMAVFDPHDQLQYANLAFRQAFGLDADSQPTWAALMRHSYHSRQGTHIDTPDIEAWLASATSRRGKMPFRAFECDFSDQRWMWMTETVNTEGWMLCIACDISSLRADSRSLRTSRDAALRESQTDVLTGISNRRHILQQLEQQLLAPAPHSCIAILDLDHFKHINDHYGHPFGDSVLRDFARHVQQGLRISDGFGRLGGEEFMVLLRRTSLGNAKKIVQKLIDHTRQRCVQDRLPDFRYTCSAGLCELAAGETLETTYARADAALYRAKQAGRDQLAIAPPHTVNNADQRSHGSDDYARPQPPTH